jgi:hypothetical protein
MTESSSNSFSANDRISWTLFRTITDNRSVTTGFGFYPETRAEFSFTALCPWRCDSSWTRKWQGDAQRMGWRCEMKRNSGHADQTIEKKE